MMINEEAKPIKLPTSGQVLGIIIRSLGINSEILNARTARRYFEGGDVSQERKLEIIEEFARVIVESGVIPEVRLYGNRQIPAHKLIASTLLFYAENWDQLAGQIRSTPLREVPADLGVVPYLRLVVIDLSIRIVGLLRLTGSLRLLDGVPIWAEENKQGILLRKLHNESGLTRERLAEFVEVSGNTVDSWLDSKSYPTDFNVDVLASIISKNIPGSSEKEIRAQVKRHYMLCRISDLVSQQIGRQALIELASHLLIYINRLFDGFILFSELPEEQAREADVLLVMLGSRYKLSEDLIRSLLSQETDPVWIADLLAVSKDWYSRLVLTSQYLSSYDESVKWAKEHLPVSSEEAAELIKKVMLWTQGDHTKNFLKGIQEGRVVIVKGDAKSSASNRMVQAKQAMANGDNETAIVHLRRAIELQPLNAEYHFHLGATLGQMKKVEEGILECKKAVELKPDWDLPRIEIGIILGNNGRFEESRKHLEEIAKLTGKITTHLAVSLGYARMHCKDIQGALEVFEIAIKEKPDHAFALDYAAHCCFLLGNTDRGIALAKEALKYGASLAYRDWRGGKYKVSSILRSKGVG